MTNEWGHLPNAYYIDCILSLLRSKPKMWEEIYMADEELWNGDLFQGDWYTVDDIVRTSTRYQAWLEVLSGAPRGARSRTESMGPMLARGAILALIAYDDAAQYLEWDAEKLKVMSILTESPAQILMLPAVRALNQRLVQG